MELESLYRGLETGTLSPPEQQRLAVSTRALLMAEVRETHIGPLPHADLLNRYDDATRQIIVQMAVDEQRHTHQMQAKSLDGAIRKDRRGQVFGLLIALTGLLVAGFVATFSPTAAAVIGSIDLLGMVALFVAPRVLEGLGRSSKTNDES
ncbi:DUF2335 domain-containing protein [Allochromatium palmeri]|nr:DUF2335 domain-containing protein [Allochromatium palmeri]